MDLDKSLIKLENLYSECPEVVCNQCGLCCVSPHMSFIEFIYFLKHINEKFSKAQWIDFIKEIPEISKSYHGNVKCPFHKDNLCNAHVGRCLSCRLEGLNIIDKMSGRDEALCTYSKNKPKDKTGIESKIQDMIDRLDNINSEIYEYYTEPYFLDALNIQCWFAVCFDQKIKQDLFLKLREIIFSLFNIEYLTEYYKDYTKLSDKLNFIDDFVEQIYKKNYVYSKNMLLNMIEVYPLTGSYYQSIAKQYIEYINDILSKE